MNNMKKTVLLLASLLCLLSLTGCNFTDLYDSNVKNADGLLVEAKSYEEFNAEMERKGINAEFKKTYAVNDVNEKLEFLLSISAVGENKYIRFEFPVEAIEEYLNKESIITIDQRDIKPIETIGSEGVEIVPEGVVWKVSYKKGFEKYCIGFYIKSRNNAEEVNGELTLSHGAYHWRGNY